MTPDDELRRRAARRAEFIALAAHDVRSPLAAIIGSAQTLRQRTDDLTREQRDGLLAVIETEAERLTGLLDDVFATSRVDADGFDYTFSELNIAVLVDEAVAAALAGRAVEIVQDVVDGLPAVSGDRARLRQVLSNLIENAVKYAPGSTVEVRARAANGMVSVSVTDDGEGIAPDDQQLIFERFGRAVDTAGKPGTGLGLYISRSIVEAHGGTLDVSSKPGEGATFTLTLPSA